MNRYKYYLLPFLFSLITLASFAQDDDDKDDDDDDDTSTSKHKLTDDNKKNYFVFSARASVTVPHAVANSSFRKSFVGIYSAEGGLDIMIYKGLFIGGSGSNSFMKIPPNKISKIAAKMEIDNAAGKIGGDFFLGERNRIIFSTAFSVGQNWTHYYGLYAADPHKGVAVTSYTTTYYQPEVNLYFLVDDNMAVGANVSYIIYDHVFDPYELSLNDWAPFNSPPIAGNTQCVNFGITFYYNFLRKKRF